MYVICCLAAHVGCGASASSRVHAFIHTAISRKYKELRKGCLRRDRQRLPSRLAVSISWMTMAIITASGVETVYVPRSPISCNQFTYLLHRFKNVDLCGAAVSSECLLFGNWHTNSH